MIKINFYLQIVMVGLLVLIILASFASLNIGYLYMILYLQIPLGITQYFGGFSLRFLQKDDGKKLNLYLLSATINLFVLFFFEEFDSTYDEELFMVFFIGLPWLLAIYYWFISFKLYKGSL